MNLQTKSKIILEITNHLNIPEFLIYNIYLNGYQYQSGRH